MTKTYRKPPIQDLYLKRFIPINRLLFSLLIMIFCNTTQSAFGFEKVINTFLERNEQVTDLSIKGKITDTNGEFLVGVNVIEQGTSNGTITDVNGAYNLTVSSAESILIFSSISFSTQKIRVGNQSNIDIELSEDTKFLSELVVVGYGTQESKDITGAVTTLKNESFNKGIINSPEELLQGKVAGVNVTSASGEPGGSQAISIRGIGGVRTGSTPLFVVDGFALDNSATGGATNPLVFINPQDIESIDVLKDASATAIYGARGANGVILITTRRAKKETSNINFSSNIGFSNISNPLPVLSADVYRKEIVKVGGILQDGFANTDWQDEITRAAVTQNYNVSLSGAADELNYYVSLGLKDQEGILLNSELKRYSGRINVSQEFFSDRLKMEINLNATNTESQRPPISDMLGLAISTNPTLKAKNPDGSPVGYLNANNPLRNIELYKDITTTNRVLGNISPSLTITKGLVYKLNFGVDYSNSTRDVQRLASELPQQDGSLTTIYLTNTNRLIENYLTYDFDLSEHNFTVLAGHSYQRFFFQSRSYSIGRFPISEIEPRYNPGLGQELTLANNRPTGSTVVNELQSFFGRVNYQWKDKYLLTATVRADGSSKFGDNNKYGVFPSFSAGWRISEESFMPQSLFSNLKIRIGWGQTGNQEIPSKITQSLFTAEVSGGTSYPLTTSGNYPAGITFARLSNPDIQWEVSTQTNIGLDFELLEGALSGTIDAFRKVSDNILLEVIPADPVQPASTFWDNVDDMTITNQGLEIALNYEYFKSNNLSFNVGGNVTFIKNEIKNSPYTVIPSGSASGSGLTSATINGYINGESIGTFFLPEFIGFDEAGNSVFKDTDEDGIFTNKDRIAAGSALPNLLYNFYGNVKFKGFDLIANFNGVSGNKIYDNTANAYLYKLKLTKGVNVTPSAIADTDESVNNSAPVSTRYLKNGSFLRLNNLTLGYSFNTETLGINNMISSLRLSITGQNLFVITDYDGYDPEVNTNKAIDGVSSFGIDYLSYPKAKSILFGLNITF